MDLDPLDPLDDLASAYLDDEVTPEERARVEQDPELVRRVARLRQVRERLLDVSPVDPAERRDTLAAALAVFDTVAVGTTEPVERPEPAVVPLPDLAAARLRRARRTRAAQWLGAAAAVGILGVGITRLGDDASMSADDTDQAATVEESELSAATESAEAGSDQAVITAIPGAADVAPAEQDAAEDTVAAFEATEPAAGQSRLDVPQLVTDADLAAFVATLGEASGGSDATAPAAETEILTTFAACEVPGGELVGPVRWQGTDAVLGVVPDRDAPQRAIVLDALSCAVLRDLEL